MLILLGAGDLKEASKEMMVTRYLSCRERKEKSVKCLKLREIEVIYKDGNKQFYNIVKT